LPYCLLLSGFSFNFYQHFINVFLLNYFCSRSFSTLTNFVHNTNNSAASDISSGVGKDGFIGMGNMGYAMLKGVLNVFEPSDIIFTCPDLDKCKRISDETGVKYAESNAECANNAQYIVLAVKPQVYSAVMKNIVNVIREDSVVISIAPGITIDSIKDNLGINTKVVRAMPNTPALVGEGMTGVSYNKDEFSFEQRDVVDRFFNSFGKVVYVDEKLMDVIVCASGSSPAYVYMFIEALADSAVKYGIKRDDAYKLVAQTVLGSAKMVLETNEHPGVLKDKVCSPGGTTIAGVAALEEHNFRNAVIKATDACYDKCHNIK
jgi:pyrroline-5-carboxylate reductase